jgi:hypothetical protein
VAIKILLAFISLLLVCWKGGVTAASRGVLRRSAVREEQLQVMCQREIAHAGARTENFLAAGRPPTTIALTRGAGRRQRDVI